MMKKIIRSFTLVVVTTLLVGGNFTARVEAKDYTVEGFVTRLYKLCLDRNDAQIKADKGGFNYWVKSLKNKTKTASEVAHGFFFSDEFVKYKKYSDEQFVEKCYQVMMDRNSDAGGKKFWLNKLTNGISREYVLKGFIDSKEFNTMASRYGVVKGNIQLTQNRDKNEGVSAFIARNYVKILGRQYEEGGMNYWCGHILNSSNQKEQALQVAFGFFNSTEFTNKRVSDDKFVELCYETFLGRAYECTGKAYWLAQLKAGSSRNNVIVGFASSTEFNTIMNSYGITGSIVTSYVNYGAKANTSHCSVDKTNTTTNTNNNTGTTITVERPEKTSYELMVEHCKALNQESVKRRVVNKAYELLSKYKTVKRNVNLENMAKLRSKDLQTDFSHNSAKISLAAKKANAGRWYDVRIPYSQEALQLDSVKARLNDDGTKEFKSYAREAIRSGGCPAYWIADYEGAMAKSILVGYQTSPNHWSYVGSEEYPYVGVWYEVNSSYTGFVSAAQLARESAINSLNN